jgi:small nuclear ribonucleoprotein (snRNP)-like protein
MDQQETARPVVLRFRNGQTERATLAAIDEEQQHAGVERDGGATADVPFSQLKAIFYPLFAEAVFDEEPAGSTVTVEFSDGEVIRGTANLNPEKPGFFLYPLDRSKNDKIFVVTSAITSIEVERL